MNGRGRAYDDDGNPVLIKGETIKGKAVLRFGVYRSLLSSKPVILDFYEGTVYLTDRRILGIRRPDPKRAALGRLPYTADMDVLESADRAKMVLEKGGYEYFSLRFDEPMKIKIGRLVSGLDIIAFDQKTHKKVRLTIAPEEGFRRLFAEGEYMRWLAMYGKKPGIADLV
jgi:hypothetical protein